MKIETRPSFPTCTERFYILIRRVINLRKPSSALALTGTGGYDEACVKNKHVYKWLTHTHTHTLPGGRGPHRRLVIQTHDEQLLSM